MDKKHLSKTLAAVLLGLSFLTCTVSSWADQWDSPDGRISFQNRNGIMTAIDVWTKPGAPDIYQGSEITFHLSNEWDVATPGQMERMNLGALGGPGAQYRLGIERGGSGIYRPFYFCFENVPGGGAYCPMRITVTKGIEINIVAPGANTEQWVSLLNLNLSSGSINPTVGTVTIPAQTIVIPSITIPIQ